VNSPAEEAGLTRGDMVLEINRQPVKSVSEYREAVSGAKPGDSTPFPL
jgi:S1-C subfamily serine protease